MDTHDYNKPTKYSWWAYLIGSALCVYAYRDLAEFRLLLYDDPYYVQNRSPHLQRLSYWGSLLTLSVANLWHPLTVFSHDVVSGFTEKAPWIHHAVNLCLHLTNGALILIWLRALKVSHWISCFTALLWLLHPTVVESTSWVSGRKDLLGLLFCILTLIVAHNSPKKWWLILITAILAMLSKPTAIMLPGVLIMQHVAMSRESLFHWKVCIPVVKRYLPVILVAIVVVILTLYFQSQGEQSTYDPRSFFTRAAGASWTLLNSVKLWFFPLDLHISYTNPLQLPVIYLFGGAFSVALMITVVCSKRLPPIVRIGFALFFLFLFPTLGFVRAGNNLLADRYLYFSGVGLTMVLVHLLSFSRWLLIGVSIVILLLFSQLTWQQRQYWRTTELLFQRVVAVKPNHSYALGQLGELAKRSGEHERAKELFNKALVINGHDPTANLHLGDYALERRDYQKAYDHYLITAKLRKNDWLLEGMAKIAWNLGRKDEARVHLEKAYKTAQSADMRSRLDQLRIDFAQDH